MYLLPVVRSCLLQAQACGPDRRAAQLEPSVASGLKYEAAERNTNF